MVQKDLSNKVAVETETKITRAYSFPKEGIVIEASTMEEAVAKKDLLFPKEIK